MQRYEGIANYSIELIDVYIKKIDFWFFTLSFHLDKEKKDLREKTPFSGFRLENIFYCLISTGMPKGDSENWRKKHLK